MSLLQTIQWLILKALMVVQADPTEEKNLLGRIEETLRTVLGPSLKRVHQPFDEWLGSLPMSVALGCAVGLYVVALAWVWTLHREFVFRGAPDQKWWRDLRIWATLVAIPYVAVYLLLGR